MKVRKAVNGYPIMQGVYHAISCYRLLMPLGSGTHNTHIQTYTDKRNFKKPGVILVLKS